MNRPHTNFENRDYLLIGILLLNYFSWHYTMTSTSKKGKGETMPYLQGSLALTVFLLLIIRCNYKLTD